MPPRHRTSPARTPSHASVRCGEGTVAAVGNNAGGVVGVAWQARVMPVKGLDSSGQGWSSLLANAVVYAADNGADVINNSWGGPGASRTRE